ncbi:insulinase family protein [Oligoflexia bacterium]|nr:insulinase family protein [Oligoflexia bacterium]
MPDKITPELGMLNMNINFTMQNLLCILLAASMFCAAEAFSDTAKPDTSKNALSALAKDVHYFTLKNGLRVILYRRAVAPVFAGVVSVRVGGVNEIPGQTGISHMLEHMAFKGTPFLGTKDYQREKELLKEVEELAAQFGEQPKGTVEQRERWERLHAELNTIWDSNAYFYQYNRRGAYHMNATTAKELTNYYVNLPRNAFEFWCWMESERFLNPVMRQFYKERDVIMEERRMNYEDRPTGKLYEKLLGIVYLSHPYRNPVIGYAADLKKLTATQVERFMKQYYVPSNMAIAVVGDVDPKRDLKVIERYFGRLPAGELPRHPTAVEPQQEGERQVTLKLESSPELALVYRKPQYPDPDDAPLALMLKILAGSNISPLYSKLVKQDQLAVNLSYFEAPGAAYPNFVFFHIPAKNPHTNQELLRAFDKAVLQFKVQGVTEKQLATAKRSLSIEFLNGIRSNKSLALQLLSSELVYGDWKVFLEWYDQLARVTTSDVERVAKQYLVAENRTVGMIETR